MLRGPTIRVPQLKKLLTEKGRKLCLFNVAYTLTEPVNHDKFKPNSYGNFETLMNNETNTDFFKKRLPGAVHCNLDIASFQGKYCRQRALQRGDLVVVYGRGPFGGMLFAARAWWLLKVYGMDDVAVLEGGMEKWKEEGGELKKGKNYEPMLFGDWEAVDIQENRIVRHDDLAKMRLDEACQRTLVNLMYCRSENEFGGGKTLPFQPNGVMPSKGLPASAPGARLPGSKCLPLSAVIAPNGELKSTEEIRGVLNDAGYDPSKPTYTMCNGGTQAALLGLALEKAGVKWSLYNGSLREVPTTTSSDDDFLFEHTVGCPPKVSESGKIGWAILTGPVLPIVEETEEMEEINEGLLHLH